jgi:hypothetical protein
MSPLFKNWRRFMNSVNRTLSLAMLISFGLVACGEGDSGSASAPAESATAPAAMSSESSDDSMAASMAIEKAEGVIYQDEIYANWPYN